MLVTPTARSSQAYSVVEMTSGSQVPPPSAETKLLPAALWRDELLLAREVFLTTSVQGIVPVATLEGRPLPERAFAALMQNAHTQAVEAEIG